MRSVMREALGDNLFTAEGDQWLRRRRPVAPLFAATEMNHLAAIMASSVADEIARWSPGATDDVQTDLTDLTIRVACRALLGTDPAVDALGGVVRARFEELLDWVTHRFSHLTAPPAVLPTPRNRAMKSARGELRSAVHDVVAQRRRSGLQSFDVISQLLRSQQDGAGVSDEDIVDECVGFLFAGHETTAATLTWALYELATHPADQEKVAAEGDRFDPDTPGLHDIAESLDHTGRVVEETLRLYPAGIGIVRVAKQRTVLFGERVRRGTIVLISLYSMQRSSVGWERPDHFEPNREPLHRENDELSYHLPFGMGPRRCLGARFARTEMRLALAMIASRWVVSYLEPRPPCAAVIPSLRPAHPLRLHLDKRNRTAKG